MWWYKYPTKVPHWWETQHWLSYWRDVVREQTISLSRFLWRSMASLNYTGSEIKWTTLCRRHFQTHFLGNCILIKSSLQFVPKGPINNFPALVQISQSSNKFPKHCPVEFILGNIRYVSIFYHLPALRWGRRLKWFYLEGKDLLILCRLVNTMVPNGPAKQGGTSCHGSDLILADNFDFSNSYFDIFQTHWNDIRPLTFIP